jgi:hypothetical protein
MRAWSGEAVPDGRARDRRFVDPVWSDSPLHLAVQAS